MALFADYAWVYRWPGRGKCSASTNVCRFVDSANHDWPQEMAGMQPNAWLLVSGLVALMALAAIFGNDPQHSIEQLGRFAKGFVLAVFVGGVIVNERQIREISLFCVAAVAVGACIAIGQALSGTYAVNVADVQRAGGLSDDPNDAAMLLLTGIPLAVHWFNVSKKRYAKFIYASIFVITIGAIILTQSRGGTLALLLVLLLLFLRRPSVKTFAAGTVLLATAGILFMSSGYWERMETISTIGNSGDGSLQERYRFAQVGIGTFLDHPVLGVGIGNFGEALAAVDPQYAGTNKVAHNMYLEFFVENGAFAGIVFLTLLGSAVLYPFRYGQRNRLSNSEYNLGFCLSVSLIAMMAAGLFLSQGENAVLWFLVGLGLAYARFAFPSSQSDAS